KLLAAEEYSIECAILKVKGSEILDFVVDEAVQIYGGMGFSEETPVARAYRDSRINRIFEGTNEINRLLCVNMLLRKAQKNVFEVTGPARSIQKEPSTFGTASESRGYLGEEFHAIRQFKKLFLIVTGAAM